jgi:hypothetical protein
LCSFLLFQLLVALLAYFEQFFRALQFEGVELVAELLDLFFAFDKVFVCLFEVGVFLGPLLLVFL